MDIDNIIVTAAEMKEIEKKAADKGLSYYQMMENAGTAASDFIKSKEKIKDKSVLVFCGKGNNGGDGYVVARKLRQDGGDVKLVMVDGEPKTPEAIRNKMICEELAIPILRVNDLTVQIVDKAFIIVDGIYGTGVSGVLRKEAHDATKLINDSPARIYSLDIPSGVNGDSGSADPDAVEAYYTIVFHRYKPAHKMASAQKYCGNLVLADIGIDSVQGV